MNDTNFQPESLSQTIAYDNRNNSSTVAILLDNEEEQIVSSTSSDAVITSIAHLQRIDTLLTSPARITSTTGNDCNSSPRRILLRNASSEDDSQSPQQVFAPVSAEQQLKRNQQPYLDGAIATTSAAAAAAQAASHCLIEAAIQSVSISNINGKIDYNSCNTEMVAREILSATVADSAGSGSGSNAAAENTLDMRENTNENHKIILKLPKPTATSNANDESHIYTDPTTSSCSSSSNSCSAEETRKVEPLKINLHSHHTQNVPKITIKPIIKKQNDAASDCSSSADDDATALSSQDTGSNSPIRKLTIKSSTSMESSSEREPHIVPKLTIRSASEEGGMSHSSIVPKLTIKMNDTQMGQLNNLLSPSVCSSSSHAPKSCSSGISSVCYTPSSHLLEQSPPPLPKLTIKTSQDGTSESIISTISPASSSPLSSSSSTSALATSAATSSFVTTAATSSCISNASVPTVPKLTIKTLQKIEETVPKLTIKTNASGVCVSTSDEIEPTEDSAGSKIPKLTIKTGQEHAVIITQYNDTANAQSIPKLTIKTKSLDVEEFSSDPSEDPPPEKIPKITIKTNETPTETTKFCIKAQHSEMSDVSAIPKLTISVANVESVGAPQSPLVVRQLASTSRKSEVLERVPKLMISRQDSVTMVTNHCDVSEKTVPKLTIKTHNMEATETKEKTSKFAIKSNCLHEDDKIPKLTIKPIPPMQQSSEDSDDCLSVELSSPVPQAESSSKVVPKLTIKNLQSPKLKMKVVLEDNTKVDIETASKNCVKSSDAKNERESSAPLDAEPSNTQNSANENADNIKKPLAVPETVTNGESSNSQEFCGFNDIGTDSAMIAAPPAVENEEPRRNSDDMDIDEGLQSRDPQVFNNVTEFSESNGDAFAISIDTDTDHLQPTTHSELSLLIDTVDLTSSPSEGSSPTHFDYTDADPQVPLLLQQQQQQQQTSTLLMERLQRDTDVLKTVTHLESTNFLLSQLTAPLAATKNIAPPPLQPKPQLHNVNSNISAKYPQLTERLLANGATLNSSVSAIVFNDTSKQETVIDSIEILDTPEGSPRSSLDEAAADFTPKNYHMNNHLEDASIFIDQRGNDTDVLRRNNNKIDAHRLAHVNHVNLKRHMNATSMLLLDGNLTEECLDIPQAKVRRIENESHTMATLTILTNDQSSSATVITTSPTIIGSNHCSDITTEDSSVLKPHRSRKQKHEHLLNLPNEEEDPLQLNSDDKIIINPPNCFEDVSAPLPTIEVATPPPVKRRGRPKKISKLATTQSSIVTGGMESATNDAIEGEQAVTDTSSNTRRVQLLRKRLAIDMVASEQPTAVSEQTEGGECAEEVEIPRRDRALRISRRSTTPNNILVEKTKIKNNELTPKPPRKRMISGIDIMANLNHYGGSNSSLSSACSNSSLSSTTITTTSANGNGVSNANSSLVGQIDLTMMSSCSSSTSNGSTTATLTTVVAGVSQSRANSMLPPTTILSSSDPVPDVIFKPNDFSSIMATQQLRTSIDTDVLLTSQVLNRKRSRTDSQDEDGETGGSGPDNSGDDSANSSSPMRTPGRGRGRGRGSRGSRGGSGSVRGPRSHRLGRGASAVAKAIALSRPRCVGGLKHTPDPDRMKGLFSPFPPAFEEDTRMSADLSQIAQPDPVTPMRQPDFLTNEESQSSIMSNNSILDPNTVVAVQNGSAIKRPKKKKMEVCVVEESEFTVASIAEYDWPPPKGCCPSKNRDTFMIQEQVALYLGIKSFKRKYPDLPRRQVDMEERNWLQEKSLVTEKMCDLGITAVWASDILDIMYADFYEKYEEYKDFIRQKHVREIETKQKALGLNVSGRGLQARDRAMLSASKWNSYFNKSRKEERLSCLDLQTLTVNVPLPATAPTTTLVNRPIAEAVSLATLAENILEPPTLLKPRVLEKPLEPDTGFPISLVPGQFSDNYRHYSPLELRSYPLNTVLDDPQTLLERLRLRNIAYSDTDADSMSETGVVEPKTGVISSNVPTKRLPTRRSRRARTKAAAERSKIKCDTKNGDEKGKFIAGSSSSETSSSDDSSSETDTESDSCSSSSNSEDEVRSDVCGVCQRVQYRNLKDLPELFIKCYTCRRKVHPSCIEMPHRMVARVRNYNWQCVDCKCCIKCKRKQDENKMLFCEQCDRGFHIYCLGVKAVPDGRWSCERCSVCMRCGATKSEGLPQHPQSLISPSGEKIKQIKHKKVKWINEYRIDHITKLREHCSMLCVPCGRAKTTKRIQIANSNNNSSNSSTVNSGSNPVHPSAVQNVPASPSAQHQQPHQIKPQQVCNTQMSPPPAPISSNTTAAGVSATALSPPPVVA